MFSSMELFKVKVMSKYFPNVSQNFATFQVLEPKTIVSHKTGNLPEAFEMQSGKQQFFSFRVIILRFDTTFGFSSNLVFLGLKKGQLHVFIIIIVIFS